MFHCETCQTQMLEYLYDLLEADERRQFQAHLDGCPSCQASLRQAQGQQSLLATAARQDFSGVQFQPPVEEPVSLPLPVPARVPARRPAAWKRWAMAAAVLLAVGIPATWLGGDYASVRRQVNHGNAVVAQARQERNAVARQLAAAPRERLARFDAAREDIERRQLQVNMSGPKAITAGAPAEFHFQVSDLAGKPVDAAPTVRLMDDMGKTSDPIPVVGGGGEYRLSLPAKLPVTPHSQMRLVVSAKLDGAYPAELGEWLPVARPGLVTHLTTDKPMYQKGEIVHFRSLALEQATLKPSQENLHFVYTVTNPRGAETVILQGSNGLRPRDGRWELLKGPDGQPVRGIGTGLFLLEKDAPGGEYVLTVREQSGRFSEQKRKFVVNEYQKPRLNKELDFNRKSYGAGDEVQALCKALRADGGAVKERDVEVTVTIDGKSYGADGAVTAQPMRFKTDEDGRVTVRFRLPKEIEKGQASVSVLFNDGANSEAIVRPIPIVLKNLVVDFFPEGGDLIADLPARVYFLARTPLGKPADLKGRLLEDGKPLPVEVQTLTDDKEPGVNQGMGRFDFEPKAGRAYHLQIDSPAGIGKRFALPIARKDGVVLRIDEALIGPRQAIKVSVKSDKPRNLLVAAVCRGQVLDSVRLGKDATEAELKPTLPQGGVVRVTVNEQTGPGEVVPVAERLIYRQSSQGLHVAIKADRAAYVPGQKPTLRFEALNENEQPTAAVLMVAVVDKSVLTLADEKTARTMPTHFLLTSEVQKTEDLEYADFLLGPHAKAGQALDLLLGTKGWRRFAVGGEPAPDGAAVPLPAGPVAPGRQAFGHPALPMPAAAQRATAPVLVASSQPAPEAYQAAQDQAAKIKKDTLDQVGALSAHYRTAEAEEQKAKADAAYVAATAKLNRYHDALEQVRQIAVPVLAALLVLAVCAALAINLGRAGRPAVPFYVASAALGLLLAVLIGTPDRPAGVPAEMAKLKLPVFEEEQLATDERENAAAPKAGTGFPGPDATALDAQDKNRHVMPKILQGGPGRGTSHTVRPSAAPVPPEAAQPGLFDPMARKPADGKGAEGKGDKDAADDVFANLARVEKQALFAADFKKDVDRLKKDGEQAERKEAGKARMDARRFVEGERLRELRDLAAGGDRPGEPGKDKRGPGWAGNGIGAAMIVREYAHQRLQGSTPEMRSDFTETLFWHPVLVLPDGKGKVSFDLCDSVTTFQATVFAHTLDGRLGAATQLIESRLPFTLQPKTPIEVTAGDRIDVPLSVSNNTPERRVIDVALEQSSGLALTGDKTAGLAIGAESARRHVFRFQPTIKEGEAVLVYRGKTKDFADDTIRTAFRVVPEGFPINGAQSDLLESSAIAKFTLPVAWVPGTLKLRAQVYPSTLADLQKGLDSLLREPCGCFEQTSTSNYPNLLILDYLRESDQARPDVEKRARELVARGYAKLTSFECTNTGKNRREGYEWFGGTAPAHEALTAYGLLQFRDMARVAEVDAQMLKRTQDYLLARRDGQGGFERNARALDTFGRAPANITNAYIVWALTESGQDDEVSKELAALSEQAGKSKDPYFLALVANSLINRARTADGVRLLRKVVEMQTADGYLQAETTSITGSGGRDLQIETTALAVLGWLKGNTGEFKKPLDKAISWIGKQRGGYGGFGSTQSTILALKALIAYTKANKRTAEAGELTLFVDDKKAATLKFPAGVADTLTLELPEAEKHLKAGANKVRLEITGKNTFPYTIGWSYQTMQPASADDCTVRLTTSLAKTEAKESDSVRLNVKVENTSDKGQGMAVAIVGLPGGAIVPEDLKQLRDYLRVPENGSRPLVSAFEIRGRELVLYWRDLAPKQVIEVPIDLTCRVPGEYTGPASRAYLYYNADKKHWIEPLKVKIAARE